MTANQTKILTLLSTGPKTIGELEDVYLDQLETTGDDFEEGTRMVGICADALKELEDAGLISDGEEFDDAAGDYIVRRTQEPVLC
jgi:hypothetical protein